MTVKNNKKQDFKTLRINKDIHKKIRILASLEGTEIQTLVEKILSEKIEHYPQITKLNIRSN